jgi:hypothetical protein
MGLQPLRRREGGSPTWGQTQVWIASSDTTAIFNGDPVQQLLQPVVSGAFGEYITQGSSSAGTNPMRGIFRGCEYLSPTIGRKVWSEYWPGTGASSQVDVMAYIEDDELSLWMGQCSSYAVLGSSNIGQAISVTANASTGNTTTQQSGVALASSLTGTIVGVGSSATAANLYPFRIVDFYSNYAPPGGATVVNGTDNTTAGQIMIVAPLFWTYKIP